MNQLLAPELSDCRLVVRFCPDGRPEGHQDSVRDNNIDQLQLSFNPKHVMNGRVVAAAILRAHSDWQSGSGKTKSLEHEVYYCLSRQWQLEKALELFRAAPTGACVLATVVTVGEGEKRDEVDVWETDLEWLLEYYKIGEGEVRLPGGVEAAILARIATRDI